MSIYSMNCRQMQTARSDMQIIFQDSFASLNPRMTVGDIIGEAFVIHNQASGRKLLDKVAYLLEVVGLQPDHIRRYPHQFSGG